MDRSLGNALLRTIVYPVPDTVAADQIVSFDAVLLPEGEIATFNIILTRLAGPGDSTVTLPLERLNGASHRAVFFPPGEGAWAWHLAARGLYRCPQGALPLPGGIVTISRRRQEITG